MKGWIVIVAVAAVLSGCVGAGMEGAHIGKDRLVVSNNIEAARKGDAEAQYRVGEALCCSPREETGVFYNTRESIGWLCAAARQGHAPAMYKIGKIYSGDVVDGVRLIRRTAMGVAGSSENLPVAYAWLRRAADRGVDGAADRVKSVWEDLSPAARRTATAVWHAHPDGKCLWDDVIRKQP